MALWMMFMVIGLTTDADGGVFYGPNQQYIGFNIRPNIQYNLAESGVPVPKSNRQRIVLKYCHRSFFTLSANYNVSQGSIEVSISPSLVSIRTCLHPGTYLQCSKNVTVQKTGTFFQCAKMAPFWLTWNSTGHVTLGSGNVFGTNVLLQHHGNVDVKVYYIFYGIDGEGVGTYCFIFDLPPLLAGSLTLQVTEDAVPGTVLHTFAHLRPKKVYGEQFFKQGIDSSVVNITQTQLLLQRRLDYDSGKTSYAFNMICKNESAGVNLTVIIDVIDVQDDKPVIYKRQGIALIEELPSGSPVGPWFLAYDRDKGDQLIYSLSGPDAGFFSIDESTGQVTTKERIDREKTSLLTVSLKVKDKAGHEATTEMKVNILNVNDNQPLFKKPFQRLHLPMSHRDEYLTTLDVTDADEGLGTCHCFVNITGGNEDNVFRLEGLLLKTNLEMLMDLHVLKNKDFQHLVTVTATDRPQRGHPLSTSAFVFTTVEKPRNYQEPAPAIQYHFTPIQHPKGVKSIQISVAEDAKGIVHTVAVPESYDMSLETAHRQFHFKSDTVCPDGRGAKEHFHLNGVTGELAVARRLNADRGGCPVFTLTIYIVDYRTLTETTFVNLTITVTNTNDNPPTSSPPWILTRLPCNIKPGHHVAVFKLSDADSGKNNIKVTKISKTMFKYKLESGSKGLSLRIDKGEKPWTKPFRHDVVKIRATDSDVNPLSVVFFAAIQRGDCSKSRRRRAAMSAVKSQNTRQKVGLNSGSMVRETLVDSSTRRNMEYSQRQENTSMLTLDFGGEMINGASGVDYASTSSSTNVKLYISPSSTNVEPDSTSSSANVEQDSAPSSTNVEQDSTPSSTNVEQDSTPSPANAKPDSTASSAYVGPHSTARSTNVEQYSAPSPANVEPDSTSSPANAATFNTTNSTNTQNISRTNPSSTDPGVTKNPINVSSRDSMMVSVKDLRQLNHYAWSSTSSLMTVQLPSGDSYTTVPAENVQGPYDCFSGYDAMILLLLCLSLMINAVLGVIVFALQTEYHMISISEATSL